MTEIPLTEQIAEVRREIERREGVLSAIRGHLGASRVRIALEKMRAVLKTLQDIDAVNKEHGR